MPAGRKTDSSLYGRLVGVLLISGAPATLPAGIPVCVNAALTPTGIILFRFGIPSPESWHQDPAPNYDATYGPAQTGDLERSATSDDSVIMAVG
jgi:hypothetical protein